MQFPSSVFFSTRIVVLRSSFCESTAQLKVADYTDIGKGIKHRQDLYAVTYQSQSAEYTVLL